MATVDQTKLDWGDNPYIGPRTYTTAEWYKFFGRDREARDLIALIVSERAVLFYAQSGAGKSSMLQAKLVPGLGAEGFEVLPVGRVSGESGLEIKADNIFIYNLISSLQQIEGGTAGFAEMSLSRFLDNLVCEDGEFHFDDQFVYPGDAELKPRVLMIDQFEEILTTNTALWSQREDFFRQLGEALVLDDQLWVVLSMREDFIAGLDPFVHHLPDTLRNHFYMQHLNRQAALEAIKKPAEGAGRPFAAGAAEILVKNLRLIHAEDAQSGEHLAEFVEPVQLQAVCYQMWQRLKEHPAPNISAQDVDDYADVDTALINFYEDTIAATVAETGVAEIELRNWFEIELITEAGTRNMVFRGDEVTGELPTAVADSVKNKFIVREVVRPGGIWYELVHDRFVQPVLEANREWRLDQPLIRLAQDWNALGRADNRLLEGGQLDNFLDSNWEALGPLVAAYVAASQEAREEQENALAIEQAAARERELAQQRALAAEQQARAEEAEAAKTKLGRWIRIAVVAAVIAILLAIGGVFLAREAQKLALQADGERQIAVAARGTAESEAIRADENAAVAATNAAAAGENFAIAATNAAVAGDALLAIEAQLITSQATEPDQPVPGIAEATQTIAASNSVSSTATPDQAATAQAENFVAETAVGQSRAIFSVQSTATAVAQSVRQTYQLAWPVSVTGIEACHLLVGDEVTVGNNTRLWSQPDVIAGSIGTSPPSRQSINILAGPIWGRIRADIDFSGWWWEVETGSGSGWLWQNRIRECGGP